MRLFNIRSALRDIPGYAFLQVSLNTIPPIVIAGSIEAQSVVVPIRLNTELKRVDSFSIIEGRTKGLNTCRNLSIAER